MQRFDLIDKFKAADDHINSIKGELKAFVNNFVAAHRKYSDGQKVEVFDFEGRSFGIGFIKYARCGVDLTYINSGTYFNNEESWLIDLSDIMYAVVKAKKDGTPSERVLMWDKPRQEKTKGRYHVIAVE